ncbi:serine/threonine-protein phosphatase 6 regulatory subunit 2 [Psammomys obesus]|uniref:serine/threonine-protein phosphatase 6 regulatory subunit 2 n=1 Tax=Psammomys obesus TaxID=48139 RepID=UPI00245280CD|nr:serine/threonine-protein phosphatase 6 regulatory subunit 2 [Psammomys obesus]
MAPPPGRTRAPTLSARAPSPARKRVPGARARGRAPPPFWSDLARGPEPVPSGSRASPRLRPTPKAPRCEAGPMCVRPAPGRPRFTSASVLASLGPRRSRRDPQPAGQVSAAARLLLPLALGEEGPLLRQSASCCHSAPSQWLSVFVTLRFVEGDSPSLLQFSHLEQTHLKTAFCPLFTQDLFFKYTWNNFLHFQVELCIAAILSHAAREEQAEASGSDGKAEPLRGSGDGNEKLETPPSSHPPSSLPENMMVTHLFQKCCLVQRILEAWEANDHTQAAGGMRRGNMGHLTRIANAVVQNLEQGPVQTHISEVIRGLPADCRGRWESFVEETLMETNRRNTVDLVSTHHLHSSSEDEDIEGTFPNELSLQQAFSEYQIQQMTANFVDQFGFNDEEFADQDDNINAPFDRIAEINFNIEADEDSPSAALFEACCSDRIQPFDDDEEEDIWEDEETRCTARVMARARFGAPHVSENYSKNALDHGGQNRKAGSAAAKNMPGLATPSSIQKEGPRSESDSAGTTWTAVFDEPVNLTSAAPAAARDVGSSVWAAGPSAPEEKGWAKFTDFQPFCCSESGPRCSSPVDVEHSPAVGGQSPGTESRHSPGTEKAFGPTSPCAWNVCVTRKAPLVASDSSSSGGSDSEDDEKAAAGNVEAVCTGHGGKPSPLPRTEEAAAGRAEGNDSTVLAPACSASSEVTVSTAVATTAPSKAGPPTATVVSSSVATAVPPGPIMAVNTAAPAIVATLGTMTKDRKTDTLPEGTALNGPV